MATLIVRIEEGLKEKAAQLARSEGKSLSKVVRELLHDYVQARDIGLYVDDLWDRMGDKLSAKGIGTDAINQAIQEVRTEQS